MVVREACSSVARLDSETLTIVASRCDINEPRVATAETFHTEEGSFTASN